jgi:hypothetical protein
MDEPTTNLIKTTPVSAQVTNMDRAKQQQCPKLVVYDPIRKLQNPKSRRFLRAYSRCGSLTRAAKAAGCSPEAHYSWLRRSVGYPEAYAFASQVAADTLEDIAVQRAVRDGGDNRLLMFLLRGIKPQKYGDAPATTNILLNQQGNVNASGGSAQSVRARIQAVIDARRLKALEQDGGGGATTKGGSP